jgi:glycosyltransferase involved in cell wall biosynthesis
VLYLSRDGLLDSLGQSQILPYLEGLAALGHGIVLVTYERADTAGELPAMRARVERAGIQWIALRRHGRPRLLAAGWDLALGLVLAVKAGRAHQVRIVHARSYVAGAMALLLAAALGARFLFDMRGFWADERADAGLWSRQGWLYRVVKRLERRLLRRADAIVSLTNAARREIEALPYLATRRPRVDVIPTCVDVERFASRQELAPDDRRDRPLTLVYAGSVGTWYPLDEILGFFGALRRAVADARLLILSGTPPEELDVDAAGVRVDRVAFAAMPERLGDGDVGIALAPRSWANTARCPTKLGEYLASGLPVVVSAGLGDADTLVEAERVGVVVRELSPAGYARAVQALLQLVREPGLAERCRKVAERDLALAVGVERYDRIYRSLGR